MTFQKSLVKIMTLEDEKKTKERETKNTTIVGLGNTTDPAPTTISNGSEGSSSGRSTESQSIDGVGSQNPNPSIRSERDNNSERDIVTSNGSQGGPEEVIHKSFIEIFSQMFSLDPKQPFMYLQEMREKLSKFNELFNNPNLMKTFLLAYSDGAVTTGKVKSVLRCKDYKTPRRYLSILVDIIPGFLSEDIQIPEEEDFPSNVNKAIVYRFDWCNQDPALNFYRNIQSNIASRKRQKQLPEPEIKKDPRIAISNLRAEIKLIDEWLKNPDHNKKAEPLRLAEQQACLDRIKELEKEMKQ